MKRKKAQWEVVQRDFWPNWHEVTCSICEMEVRFERPFYFDQSIFVIKKRFWCCTECAKGTKEGAFKAFKKQMEEGGEKKEGSVLSLQPETNSHPDVENE